MRLSTAILGAALVLGLCVACVLATRVPQLPVHVIAAEQAVQQAPEEAPVEPQALATDADTFYVSFELIVFQSQMDEYPVIWENFKKAVAEWSIHLPIRWTVLTEPVSGLSFRGRAGAIEIHFADMQSPEYGLPKSLLGLWQSSRQRIVLDDLLEHNPEKAYSVSLHELGHMLGLPHIVGFSELGSTGYVVLPPGADATNYVMYPRSVVDKPQKELSPIEIKLARHALLHDWTIPGRKHKVEDCEFLLDD